MNYSLGFPDPSRELSIPPKQSLEAVVSYFRSKHLEADSAVRAIHHQPAAEGIFADIPALVDPKLRAALEKRGITRLYSHQADAFDQIQAGKHVVIVTPTASGKTLCYNLPVLNLLMRDEGARAMYLFPTKALAEDQLHEFQRAVEEMGSEIRAFTYDGDTPGDARRAIRQRANVVLTNPDMLHSGILPHHTKWARYFENLRYIVIDELHYYRGVYGSHLANLLRRLQRICEFYNSKPQFICCSATIANPRELAEALTGEPFELVERNGAPRGEKFFIFYNPPVVNRQLGIRRSYIAETRRMALKFIENNLQTLVFANNRLATEVLVTYLKDACDRGPIPSETVRGYRGGYLPRERREIEQSLRDGKIRAVVATNALELGIDIGSLDAVVMAGYAGTIASSWQRAGRAGRRQGTSAAVLVASSAPLDQYIVEHPDYFFGRSPEHAYINPENLEILLAHLKCAAFELPLRDDEKFGRHDLGEICRFLEESGFLHHSAGAWHWTSDTYPADATSLRSVTSDNFVVVDITGEAKIIAEVSFPTALTTLHEKAIYLHEARQYHVERFDYDQRKAYVKSVDCDYYTDAIDYTQVKVLEEFEGQSQGRDPGAAAPVARRRAREPPDRRLQENQVLHHGECGRRKAQYAGAGDAHDGLLAAFPGSLPGALRGFHPHRKAERHHRPGQCAAYCGLAAADVRSARSRRRVERRDCRRAAGFRAQPLLIRHVSRRRRPECAALSPGSGVAPPDRRPAGRMRLRGGLSVVCRPHRRDGRTRQTGGCADSCGADGVGGRAIVA